MSVRPLYSPLRYAGEKRQLAQYVRQLLHLNDLAGGSFAEPFCGGAGVGLALLFQGEVERLYLNDLDPAVFAFWHAALYDSEALRRFVREVPLSAAEWTRQRAIIADKSADLLELAQAALYMNRITQPARGGQIPAYVPDARFNRRALGQYLGRVARLQERIRVSNLDAEKFLTTVAPHLPAQHLLLLDPPHHLRGAHQPQFEQADAQRLAVRLQTLRRHWLLVPGALPGAAGAYPGEATRPLPEWDSQGSRQEGGPLILSQGLAAPPIR